MAAASHAVEVRDLWKQYTAQARVRSLKTAVMRHLKARRAPLDRFWALQDVSMTVVPGEAVAVIGPNGSGKTTLLGVISGVLRPTKGEVRAPGRVCVLLDATVAFHPDLTGLESIVLQGLALGMTRREAQARIDDIVDFAAAAGYVEQPVRTYSRGQGARLGFAVAAFMSPDVFLIDEVLAVVDQEFHQTCYDRLRQLRREGCALVFVSHIMEQVRELCERAVWLEDGRLLRDGPATQIIDEYEEHYAHGRGGP